MSRTIILLALALGGVGQAGPDGASEVGDQPGWYGAFGRYAEQVVIRPTAAPAERLRLLPEVLLRFTEPVRGNEEGAVFLWVQADGRPGVVGSYFVWPEESGFYSVSHKFHSLASAPLTATSEAAVWQGRRWVPERPGVQWKPIPNAPVPAESARRQASQVRLLARRFTAHSIEPKLGRWELRLLARPLYAYQTGGDDSIHCGGLFAFCQGTAPFIWLLIEAREGNEGYGWYYACARFSYYVLQVRLDDAEAWNGVLSYRRDRDLKHPYFQILQVRKPPVDSTPEDRNS